MAEELAAARKKASEDSAQRVAKEQADKELAQQLAKAEQLKLQQQVEEQKQQEAANKARQDSVNKAFAEQQKQLAEYEAKQQRELAAANEAKKKMADSLAVIAAERERMQKELAELKAKQEEAAKQANNATQQAATTTNMAAYTIRVNDQGSGLPLGKAYITVKNMSGAEVLKTNADEAGTAQINLAADGKYLLVVSKNKFSPIEDTLVTPAGNSTGNRSYSLKKVPGGNEILSADLPCIKFEKDEYDLSLGAKQELRDIIQKLSAEPSKKVKIYAIASSDESNPKIVSLRRSDAILRFMIQNGVAIERVICVYYGSTVSRNGCTNANCPEELLSQNRCAAYELISE